MSHQKLQFNISRLIAVLLCTVLLFTCALSVRAEDVTGSCGDNLTWTLSEGILTIEGSGAMSDFPESTMAPWYEFRTEIKKLVLPEGLTSIGDLAFYDCSRLTIVDMPASVKTIGDFAFASSEKLEWLNLNDGLESIGADAFHGCWALKEVRLPQTLKGIGNQAFYDCSSITSIVVPAGVTKLGNGAFAYCTSLVWAEIQTELKILPEWTFFGCSQLSTLILPATITEMENAALRDCDNLNTVSYGGDDLSMEQLREVIAEDVPKFVAVGVVTPENPGTSASSGTAVENSDGSILEQITTVNNGSNSTVSSTANRTFGDVQGDSISSDITVSVENNDGWEEALESVQSALNGQNDRVKPGITLGTTDITIYLKNDAEINTDFIEYFAGKDAVLTVISKDGSSWKIDCSSLKKQELSGAYNLRYTVETADEKTLELMGVSKGYRIRFEESAEVETEVLIALPDGAIRQTATLFCRENKKELTRHQTVLVDAEGYAHLYLGSVDKEKEYYLAINLQDAKEEAIIPDTMQQAYPKIDYQEPIRYEITGRSSSWGMNLGQVMGIMAGVMIGVIAIVGVVFYMWNKSRLKKGYIPGWDDMSDDDED